MSFINTNFLFVLLFCIVLIEDTFCNIPTEFWTYIRCSHLVRGVETVVSAKVSDQQLPEKDSLVRTVGKVMCIGFCFRYLWDSLNTYRSNWEDSELCLLLEGQYNTYYLKKL